MKFIAAFLVLAVTLVGCAEPSTKTSTGPDGRQFHTSNCTKDPSGCYQEAAQICKGPYQVVDSYSKAGGTMADIMPGPVTWYYMSFQCGPSDGRRPDFPFRGERYVAPDVVMVPSPSYTAPSYTPPTRTTCSPLGNSVTCTSY